MSLPPQLSEHIFQLKKEGYLIEVMECEGEYCIIFKSYPLSEQIWNINNTELLVKASKIYPNSKMDMFWVTPGLLLKNGNKPKAGDVLELHCEKQWQRFSWHPQKWNPAKDNLLTYLELIEHRLSKSE